MPDQRTERIFSIGLLVFVALVVLVIIITMLLTAKTKTGGCYSLNSQYGAADPIFPLACSWYRHNHAKTTKPNKWTADDSIQFFHHGCQNGNLSIITEMIVEWGNEIVNMGRETCLMKAVRQGHYEIVQHLVEKAGADVNTGSGDWFDWTLPLHLAAKRGDLVILKYLIINGARINVIDDLKMDLESGGCEAKSLSGRTPLDEAVARNDKEMSDYLLSLGAECHCYVTVTCMPNLTPLPNFKRVAFCTNHLNND